MDRDALLRQITILDFMSTDLQLYLNTNPDDSEALEMYNDCVQNSQHARKQFEEHFGPLTGFRSKGQPGWTWSQNPWPWAEEFNFALGGEES